MANLYSCSCGDAACLCRPTSKLPPDLGLEVVNIINSYQCRCRCKGCKSPRRKGKQADRDHSLKPNRSSQAGKRKKRERNDRHKKKDGWEQKEDWHEGLRCERPPTDDTIGSSTLEMQNTFDREEVRIDPLEARRSSGLSSSDCSSPSLQAHSPSPHFYPAQKAQPVPGGNGRDNHYFESQQRRTQPSSLDLEQSGNRQGSGIDVESPSQDSSIRSRVIHPGPSTAWPPFGQRGQRDLRRRRKGSIGGPRRGGIALR